MTTPAPFARKTATMPKANPKYSKLVQSIVDSDRDYKWSPAFPRAVAQAVNLHINYLRECRERYPEHWIDEITEDALEEHDIEHIRRIATAIHGARIERGF